MHKLYFGQWGRTLNTHLERSRHSYWNHASHRVARGINVQGDARSRCPIDPALEDSFVDRIGGDLIGKDGDKSRGGVYAL